jgi:hypothetical protein
VKFQRNGQFPDEPAKIKDKQVHSGGVQKYTLLAIADIKKIASEGRLS